MSNAKLNVGRAVTAVALVAVLFGALSCLPLPLCDPAKAKVDPALVGYWHLQEKDGPGNIVAMIAPFDERAYVIRYGQYKKDQDEIKPQEQMVLKGWIAEIAGEKFLVTVPCEHLMPTDEKKVYPTFRIHVKDATLEAQGVNESFEAFKNVKTSEELAAAVAKSINDDKMYGESSTWTKLDPDKDGALIQKSLGVERAIK